MEFRGWKMLSEVIQVNEALRYLASLMLSMLHSMEENSQLYTLKDMGAWKIAGGDQVFVEKRDAFCGAPGLLG